jgi:spermidine/putrescine transport system ATP-binding protein
MNALAVEVKDIQKSFGATRVLQNISLEVGQGEFVSLVGPSGCGKTTLLRIIGGFDQPDSGDVFIAGSNVTQLPPEKRPSNMVFQRGALFPHMSVAENIGYALRRKSVAAAEINRRVNEMLSLIRLRDFGHRKPNELSGGQAQRVALARALINRPQVLLLDEPFSALDLSLRKELQLELKRIHRELSCAFVFVTHDQEEALVLSDRIAMVNMGKIVQVGNPTDIYRQPADVFAAQFIGEMNLLPGLIRSVADGHARVEVGEHVMEVSVSSSTFSTGDQVLVATRPENVQIGVVESDGLVGVIEEQIYIGSRRRYRVACRKIPVPILAETSGTTDSLEIGSQIGISIKPEVSRLLMAQ